MTRDPHEALVEGTPMTRDPHEALVEDVARRIAHAVRMQFGCDEELALEFAEPLARVVVAVIAENRRKRRRMK